MKSKTKKLTKAEQRVIIAKDALKQLLSKRFIATEGVYVEGKADDKACEFADTDVQYLFLDKKMPPCVVCARGALLVSAIRKYDDVTGDQYVWEPEIASKRYFSLPQLVLMEAAFEEWYYTSYKAASFGGQFEESKDRLEAILKNVIKNKGTFKP